MSSHCQLCGTAKQEPSQKFCFECGCNWAPDEVLDQPEKLRIFSNNLYQAVIRSDHDPETDQLRKMRLRLKVSYRTYQSIYSDLVEKLKIAEELNRFKLEFNENLLDAYAGQDTFLQFRFTNLQEDGEQFKSARLYWDDPDTPDNMDFNVKTQAPVNSNSKAMLQSSHVFQRFGPKSIDSMILTVENMYGEVSEFFVESFTFRVLNPVQQVVNYNTNNTSVNIEGRVVGDFTGLGAGGQARSDASAGEGKEPRWVTLNVRPKIHPPQDIERWIQTEVAEISIESEISQPQPQSADPQPAAAQPAQRHQVEPQAIPSQPAEPRSPAASANTTETINISELSFDQAVEGLFAQIKTISELTATASPHNIVHAADFALDFLELIFSVVPDPEEDAILGMTFENPESVDEDQHHFVASFDDAAAVITKSGITLIENWEQLGEHQISYSWADLQSQGWGFIKRRFGSNSYIFSFGERSGRAVLPGCKFDLRRYQGDVSLENIFDASSSYLDQVYSFAPSESQEDAYIDEAEEEYQEEADELSAEELEQIQQQQALESQRQREELEQQQREREVAELEARARAEEQAQARYMAKLKEVQNRLQRFCNLFGFAMQYCLENQPKSVFDINHIAPEFLDTLFEAAMESGSGMRAVCLEPQHAMIGPNGQLTGWHGSACALSAEGIFHIMHDANGTYCLEGNNSFLSWKKFFKDYRADLMIRDAGPDIWLGTESNILIRGCYADYTSVIPQWDYLTDFVKNDLTTAYNGLREAIDWI